MNSGGGGDLNIQSLAHGERQECVLCFGVLVFGSESSSLYPDCEHSFLLIKSRIIQCFSPSGLLRPINIATLALLLVHKPDLSLLILLFIYFLPSWDNYFFR